MFEFLFKYPPAIFAKGKFVLLSPWPVWVLVLLVVAAGAGLFWNMGLFRHTDRRGILSQTRSMVIWLAQTLLIAVLLLMLWRPALSVARLRPQENVVAVLVDRSRSMGLAEDGKSRLAHAQEVLDKDLIPELNKRFQVRLYGFGRDAGRVDQTKDLAADENATRIGDSLKHITAEAGTMPLGAIVLLTDGGDNTGGVDRETIAQLRQLKVPVHTIGFGPDHFAKDIEVSDVAAPARALQQSRVSARVAVRQHGFAGSKVKLTVRENGHPVSQQEIELKPDTEQSETVVFNVGDKGAHTFQIGVDPVQGEENVRNNFVTRLVNVDPKKMRVLYVDGEPRWEYKFVRRAIVDYDDPAIDFSGMVRTTQNKTYYQVARPGELANGFPEKPEELFQYDGLIIGSVEANYFTPQQQAMIHDFADRRGGGVLFLGGRFALSDGGYSNTPMAEMMPVHLLPEKSWSRDFVDVALTEAGRESPVTRLVDERAANDERWKKMPQVANSAGVGTPKPGAVVLMNVMEANHRPSPLLTIQNFGRGRVGVFASAGSWRWRMLQDHADTTHARFWQQLMRWMVAETPGPVTSSVEHQVLSDDTKVPLRVSVRDKTYQPVAGATVETTIVRPDGGSDVVPLKPDALEPGTYTGEYTAEQPGTYVAETLARQDKTDLGTDTISFRREDGVAESFGAAQNKDLLQKLSADTGGIYYSPDDAKKLPDEVAVSEGGISAHDNLDVWDMPAVFLLVLLIRGGEWLLRRKWGVV